MHPNWIDQMEAVGASVERHPGGEVTTRLDAPGFGLGVTAGVREWHVFLSGTGIDDAARAAIVAGLLAALDVTPPAASCSPMPSTGR